MPPVQQFETDQLATMKRLLLLRMHADLSRYLTQFFSGFRRMNLVKSAIGYYQRAEAASWSLN